MSHNTDGFVGNSDEMINHFVNEHGYAYALAVAAVSSLTGYAYDNIGTGHKPSPLDASNVGPYSLNPFAGNTGSGGSDFSELTKEIKTLLFLIGGFMLIPPMMQYWKSGKAYSSGNISVPKFKVPKFKSYKYKPLNLSGFKFSKKKTVKDRLDYGFQSKKQRDLLAFINKPRSTFIEKKDNDDLVWMTGGYKKRKA